MRASEKKLRILTGLARRTAPRLLAFALATSLAASAAGDSPRLDLSIDSPEPGSVIGDPGGFAFMAGKALAHFGEFQTFDILFVLDVSESTAAPSGADIDGDGEIGHRRGESLFSIFGRFLPLPNSDSGDSILAAEVAAVLTLLDQLDPRTTRVGLVGFSGDTDPMVPDAWTQVPLSTEYEKFRRGLRQVFDNGPFGRTNMTSGVNLGTVELMGSQSAFSERREGAKRIMIFLTDGTPTLPLESSTHQNTRMAISRAVRAAKAGIRIDTYAIGDKALLEPIVAVEMARVTNGIFTPVRDPRDLRAVFEQVSFAEIEELRIRNRTTGELAAYKTQNADGSFSSLIPIRPGMNTLEVYARATDGTEGTRSVSVRFLEDGGVQPLTPRLLAQRNRLMENRLLDLQRRSLEIQAERDEEIRRDIMLEIEKERTRAKALSEDLKRELELEVED